MFVLSALTSLTLTTSTNKSVRGEMNGGNAPFFSVSRAGGDNQQQPTASNNKHLEGGIIHSQRV